MRELQTHTAEEILTTVYKPIEFIIEGLLAQGLYILAGAQKIGKSWLALDICLSVATGADVLQRKTVQGTVLYFCLEDNYNRIQDRLYRMNAVESECLYFAIASERIGSGLEEQIVAFAKAHPDLKLVVIDVMQLIRSETESSYGSDYADMAVLKQLADSLGITIVLIHHTRKYKDSDPFNMISGSSGLSGCADGSFVLVETRRGSHRATLFCVGRDIESAEIQMHLDTDTMRWTVDDEPTQKKMHSNIFLSAVYVFIRAKKIFIGTPSELVDALKTVTDTEFFRIVLQEIWCRTDTCLRCAESVSIRKERTAAASLNCGIMPSVTAATAKLIPAKLLSRGGYWVHKTLYLLAKQCVSVE